MSHRDLSVREATDRLASFEPRDVRQAIERASSQHLLSDARLASRLAHRALEHIDSPRLALARIEARGINPSLAQAALEEALAGRDENLLIEQACRTLHSLPTRRLLRRLLARGFDAERVRSTVRRVRKDVAAQDDAGDFDDAGAPDATDVPAEGETPDEADHHGPDA